MDFCKVFDIPPCVVASQKKINIMKACGGFEFALGLLGDQESGP